MTTWCAFCEDKRVSHKHGICGGCMKQFINGRILIPILLIVKHYLLAIPERNRINQTLCPKPNVAGHRKGHRNACSGCYGCKMVDCDKLALYGSGLCYRDCKDCPVLPA